MSEPDEYPSLEVVEETPQEAALRQWFAGQWIKSVDNLEAAARQIISLCTALLGLLLGVMALSEADWPAYMGWSGVQWLSGLGAAGLFLALACALVVIYPFGNPVTLNDPDNQPDAFGKLLDRKRVWLQSATILFAAAVLCFALVVIISLVLLA